jgi:hypothetical protein
MVLITVLSSASLSVGRQPGSAGIGAYDKTTSQIVCPPFKKTAFASLISLPKIYHNHTTWDRN